jgi:hypothetical protein
MIASTLLIFGWIHSIPSWETLICQSKSRVLQSLLGQKILEEKVGMKMV